MSKLRWERAHRNPRGYVSIIGGPEEIVGNERPGSKPKQAQSSRKVSRKPQQLSKVEGRDQRSWPEIKDGRPRSRPTKPIAQLRSEAHQRRVTRIANSLKGLDLADLAQVLAKLEKKTLKKLAAALQAESAKKPLESQGAVD